MRMLATWLFLLLLFKKEAAAASLNFIHVTDPHLFDGGASAQENERALKWCIEEINKRVLAGAQLSFVAVTGDLGVEKLVPTGTNAAAGAINSEARRLGRMLAQSKVPLWFFVPGNNDLVGEDPRSITNYFNFIQALQKEAPELTIIDLTPRSDIPGSGRHDFVFGTNRWRIAGFDNSSFKSNDSFTNAISFSTNQLASIARLRVALGADPPFNHALIFYHVPEVEDPYYALLPAHNMRLLERERNRGVLATNYPLSAWTVTQQVRDDWNAVVTNQAIRGLIAGHFHSPARSVYESFSWIHNPAKSSNSLGKLLIAPPLAIKRQEEAHPAARGFREISFDVESGVLLLAKIIWMPELVAPASQPSDVSAAESLALIAIGAIFLAIGVSMTSIIKLLEASPPEDATQTSNAQTVATTPNQAGEAGQDQKGVQPTVTTFEVLKLGNPAIAQWLIRVAQTVFVIVGVFFIFLAVVPLVKIPGVSSSIRGWGFRTTLLMGIAGLAVGLGFLLAIFRYAVGRKLNAFFSSFRPEVVMNITFITFFLLGFSAIAIFAEDLRGFGAGSLWALGALAVGAFFGLLFGIPRPETKREQGTDSADSYRPQINNNLIEVSDWLTKIIVGVGLIELRNVNDYMLKIAQPLAKCLGEHCGLAVAAGILIAFIFSGFLAGFLNSRTFLTEILRRYDELLFRRFGSKVDPKIAALDDAPIVLEGGVAKFDALAKEAADHILTFKLEDLHNWREIRLWAKAALSKGRTTEAIKGYQRALAIVPRDAETRLEYAAALNEEGASIGVILTQLEVARDSIMRSTKPELRKNIYKSLIYQYLYLKAPESFTRALEAAREYLSTDNPVMSGGIWVNITCAYGQAYSWLASKDAEKDIKFPDDVRDLRLSKDEKPTKERFTKREELLQWIGDQAAYAARQAIRRDKAWVLRLQHLAGVNRPAGTEKDDDLELLMKSIHGAALRVLLATTVDEKSRPVSNEEKESRTVQPPTPPEGGQS